MEKAHCDICMRIVAELEHLAGMDMDCSGKVNALTQVIQDLRDYEAELEEDEDQVNKSASSG